ncbi:MAG: Kdo hydroxylase family protein [Acetobacteraceae bacterium]|nr:Kdo hydroxylase family protein [Acetobacteraceae bacterium]
MDRVASFADVTRWDGPFPPELQEAGVAALEDGQVLFFPNLAFALSDAERPLLEAGASDGRSKNVSYDPATGETKGTALAGDDLALLSAMVRRFAGQSRALLLGLFPRYEPALEQARTSFRPAEIAGRVQPWRKDDTRLHVDAFPTRPLRGRRILRVFSNIDPAATPRRWVVGEPFEQHAARFLPRLRAPLPGSAQALALLGLTKSPRSRYDHAMLELHDAAKRDPGYQEQTRAGQGETAFPAGTSWMVFTDQTPHAALSGRNALEQTFHIEPSAMADPSRAPLAVLQRLTGRAMV